MKTWNIELTTNQEQGFLKGVLELLGIAYTETENAGIISSKNYSFTCNFDDYTAISYMMKCNYRKNFC